MTVHPRPQLCSLLPSGMSFPTQEKWSTVKGLALSSMWRRSEFPWEQECQEHGYPEVPLCQPLILSTVQWSAVATAGWDLWADEGCMATRLATELCHGTELAQPDDGV